VVAVRWLPVVPHQLQILLVLVEEVEAHKRTVGLAVRVRQSASSFRPTLLMRGCQERRVEVEVAGVAKAQQPEVVPLVERARRASRRESLLWATVREVRELQGIQEATPTVARRVVVESVVRVAMVVARQGWS